MPKVQHHKNRTLQGLLLPKSLADMLSLAQIKRVTVIDDVFDSPGEDEIPQDELREFAIRADIDQVRAAATAIGIDVAGGPDQGANARSRLWAMCVARRRTPLGELAANHLFSDRLHRKQELDNLCQSLEAVSLSVKVFGAADEDVSHRRAQLIFIDYNLDPPGSIAPDEVGKRAIQKIGEIRFSRNALPYIILISDLNVTEKARGEICRAVNRKGGFFGFIHKRDLRNETMLCLKLAELGVGIDAAGRNAIRRFTTEAASAIRDAANSLTDLLHSLELQDYVHLQNRKLEGDGEGLGEYLQWILEAKLGHLFSDGSRVAPARKALDKITYTLLPTPKPASKTLLSAFHCAQTEAGIPAASRRKVISARVFMLGDVFLHRETKVARLIINPACDLVASPFPKKRQPKKDQRVYMISGDVEAMGEVAIPGDAVSSDGIMIEGRPSRIVWNLRSVTSTSYARLKAALRASKFRFIFRFRPLFALAIQRQFIEHMGRIGLPTTPPYCESGSIRIFVGNKGANLKAVGSVILHGAELIRAKEAMEGRLTVDGVSAVIDCMKVTLRSIGNRPDDELSDAEKLVKAAKVAIEEALASSSVWLPFVTQFRRSKPGHAADRIPDFAINLVGPEVQCKGPFTIVVARNEEN